VPASNLGEHAIFNKETWQFINTFAPWLSAIGTFAAVLVSLYLARQASMLNLNITAGHRVILTPGKKGPYPEFISISIINTGNRDLQITDIGWKVGFFKKKRQHAIQMIEQDGRSSRLLKNSYF